ncbi:hypothetical protein M1N67_02955 [Peptococcaceae bacterium]|nr:hypothetical protein [Peptococcaceae bacterium]
MIMWNKNDNNSDVIIGKRVLTSATIKCKGIVMSIDIAPTILKHLEIEQPSFIKGRPMYSTLTHVDNITYLQQNQDYFAAVYGIFCTFTYADKLCFNANFNFKGSVDSAYRPFFV